LSGVNLYLSINYLLLLDRFLDSLMKIIKNEIALNMPKTKGESTSVSI
jgi:hypothetical protein